MTVRTVVFDCYGVLYDDAPLKRNQALFDFADEIKQLGLKLAILSNISTSAAGQLFSAVDRDLFDEIAVSGVIGVCKPNPLSYEYLIERLLIEPSEIIFVDDNVDNIDGAKAVGMNGILHISNESTIRQIKEMINA